MISSKRIFYFFFLCFWIVFCRTEFHYNLPVGCLPVLLIDSQMAWLTWTCGGNTHLTGPAYRPILAM